MLELKAIVQFSYDVIWAAGLYSSFDLFFSALDEVSFDRSSQRSCCETGLACESLSSFDGRVEVGPVQGNRKRTTERSSHAPQIKSDADAVLQWAQGKTEVR